MITHKKVITLWNFGFCFTYTYWGAMSVTFLGVSCSLESLKATDLDSAQQDVSMSKPSLVQFIGLEH